MKIVRMNLIRSGQPRAYADTERVGTLEFEGWKPDEDDVIGIMAILLGYTEHPFPRKQKPGFGACFDPYLDYCRETAPGHWEFRCVQAFTD